jgi:diguanylate cyclase (GGDEF)-like protein
MTGPAGDERALALQAVRDALRTGRRGELPDGGDGELEAILDDLAELYEFALGLAKGNFDRTLQATGALAGSLKNLDAALRHLTWQTQRVAAGDFTQRVDFMGEFALAFNHMVVALDEARTELARRNEELQELAGKLEELATHDALTGVFNRRKLDEVMQAEIERTKRYGSPLSLVILDADHFKRVNDRFGHEAGDQALVALAQELRAGIRAVDVLARWGGEEFIVLCPAIDLGEAAELAERLRAGAAALDLGPTGRLTISLGVAQYRVGEAMRELFGRADAALYRAKRRGRDRVELERP